LVIQSKVRIKKIKHSKNFLEPALSLTLQDGAFALIGPDMNKEGKRLSAANFEIISVPEKSCLGSIELMINDAYVEKEFSCVSFFI